MSINLTNLHNVVNDSFYPMLGIKDRYMVLRGGAGSGKSVFIAQKILARILVGIGRGMKHRILVLRKTLPSAKKSVFPLFKELISQWGLSSLVKLNKTELTFRFVNGSEIIITGLDDPEKIKSIFGITSIWLEEANEFSYDDFEQLDLRLRGQIDDYYQIMISFNPIGKSNWLYTTFYEEEKEGTFLHHSTYLDNRFLDDAYKEKLEAYINKDKWYYQVYTKGEWGVLEGLIYNNWTTIDEMPSGGSKGYGMDFGFNNPSTLINVDRIGTDLFVDEILYETKQTNNNLIKFIKNNLDKRAIIICDSAEPDRIAEMKSEKIKAVAARKGKNSVIDGIDYMKRFKIHITKRSLNIIKEIQSYKWKEKKDIGVLDKPLELNDHALDAIRYYLWTVWGKKETELSIMWV